MKKTEINLLKLILAGIILFVPSIFVYLFTLEEFKTLTVDKNAKLEIVKQKQNNIEQRDVDIQRLSSEERITEIAKEKLGLIRATKLPLTRTVNANKIKNMEDLINRQYD